MAMSWRHLAVCRVVLEQGIVTLSEFRSAGKRFNYGSEAMIYQSLRKVEYELTEWWYRTGGSNMSKKERHLQAVMH